MASPPLPTAVLLVQILILVLLSFGAYQMRFRRNVRVHGPVQTVAALLNLATIIILMVPSLLRSVPSSLQLIDTTYVLVLTHHAIGLVAAILMMILAGGWLISGGKPTGCPGKPKNKRAIMLTTFGTYAVAVALGLVIYYTYYYG